MNDLELLYYRWPDLTREERAFLLHFCGLCWDHSGVRGALAAIDYDREVAKVQARTSMTEDDVGRLRSSIEALDK